jgi:hypothetical protein
VRCYTASLPGSSSVGKSAILIQSWSKVRSLPAGLRRKKMSALEPTKEEMQDLVVVVIPRVIAQAMMNPEGEWYSDEIADKAIKKALDMN